MPSSLTITIAPDLLAACIAWLRDSAEFCEAFGDGGTGNLPQKVWSDYAAPATELPYLSLHEISETWAWQSPNADESINPVAEGNLQTSIFAATRCQARQLGNLIASRPAGLLDAPLVFTDGVLLYLRPSSQLFAPVGISGVGAQSSLFHRVIEFTYFVDREV